MRTILLSFLVISLFSCKDSASVTVAKTLSKVDLLINESIEAHGGDRYSTAQYQFVFRDKTYSISNTYDRYRYNVTYKKEESEILDRLDNSGFKRTINGKEQTLSEKEIKAYSASLNSVIYFATLPYKLNDKAATRAYIGETTIKSQVYNIVSVTFKEDGGGQDFEDNYMYWINSKTKTMDYFAYDYNVNKGGVRFRSAYNSRNVEGIVFQDYINYKADVGTPLLTLPVLYEQGKLQELSKIKTEDVKRL